MSKLSRQQQMEMERQVQPWMARRGLPLVLFDKLQTHNKVLLYRIVCVGNAKPTDYQLSGLWKDLGLDHNRSATQSVEYYPTIEELREFLSPDGTPYLKKF